MREPPGGSSTVLLDVFFRLTGIASPLLPPPLPPFGPPRPTLNIKEDPQVKVCPIPAATGRLLVILDASLYLE